MKNKKEFFAARNKVRAEIEDKDFQQFLKNEDLTDQEIIQQNKELLIYEGATGQDLIQSIKYFDSLFAVESAIPQ